MTRSSSSVGKTNWRKIFFYAAEIVFAVIGGIGESYVYYAYLPPGPWRLYEAIARAVITQIAIVLFGVAAVEAVRASRGFFRKFFAAMPANIATAIASLVAFWFMRDSAIIFRDAAFLAPAEQAQFVLPNGYVLTGKTIDIYLVAALPFFQVGLNWLAPIIVQDRAAESEEDRTAREAREIADAEHKARLAKVKAQQNAVNAAGLRGAGLAFFGKVNPLDEPPQNDTSSPDESSVSVGENTADVPDQSTATSSGISRGSARTKRGQTGLHAVPTGLWTATHLREYVKRTYNVDMGEDHPVQAMSQMPGKMRLEGVRGNPYGAPKATVKRWADQTYKVGQNGTFLPHQNASSVERSA